MKLNKSSQSPSTSKSTSKSISTSTFSRPNAAASQGAPGGTKTMVTPPVFASVPWCPFDENGELADPKRPSMQIMNTPSNHTLAMVRRSPLGSASLFDPKKCMQRSFVTPVIADPIVLEEPSRQNYAPVLPVNHTVLNLPMMFTTSPLTFIHAAPTMPAIALAYSVDLEAQKISRQFFDSNGLSITTLPLPQTSQAATSILPMPNFTLPSNATSIFSMPNFTLPSIPTSRFKRDPTVNGFISMTKRQNLPTTTTESNGNMALSEIDNVMKHTYTVMLVQHTGFTANELSYAPPLQTPMQQVTPDGISTIMSTLTHHANRPIQTEDLNLNVSFANTNWNSGPLLSATSDGLMVGAVATAALVALAFGFVWLAQKIADGRRAESTQSEA